MAVRPAPSTLRITDGRQAKTEAPVMKSMDFLRTTDEVRAVLDVVIGM